MSKANNECLLVKSFEKCNISSKNQHKNLNLKQSQKCLISKPVQIFSKQNNDKFCATNSKVSDKNDEKEKQQSWKNKSIKISNFSTQNQSEREEETAKKDRKKNGSSNSTKNSSTLSFHFEVYENSIKAGTFNDGMKKENFGRKQSFFNALKLQNPFEFPRQQDSDRIADPELMQFKASQRLFDPNLSSSLKNSFQQSGIHEGQKTNIKMAIRLNDLVLSLYECATSTTEEEVRAKVKESFLSIGKKQPTLFLEASHAFVLENTRLNASNHAYVLSSIAAVLDGSSSVISQIDEQRLLLTINLAIQEMLMSKDDESEWADAAKNVLIVLSKHEQLIHHVLDGLLQKFPPGITTSPPKTIISTLAAIAQCNASGFVPFLTDILSRSVPLLSHIKSESQRSVWSRAVSSFCEALAEYSADSPSGMRSLPHISEKAQKDYSDQMEQILDSVLNWVNAKDSKCRADAFECIGSLALVVSNARVLKELKKIITTFLNLYKKGSLEDQFVMTKGICNFLVRTCSDDSIPLEPYLDDILNSIFQHVAVYNDAQLEENYRASANPTVMRLRNEVCRCFLAASQRFADRLVYYLLHKMQSVNDSTKLGAIDLIRHLLNSAECSMEDKRSLIVMGLKPLLRDEGLSVKAKMSMCQLCIALADHGYVHSDSGGDNVIFFLTSNLIADFDAAGKKITPPTQTEINQLRTHSAQALCTIAKTCESAQQLLWPNLLEFICSENYNSVVTEIFKCLRILVRKMHENNINVSFTFGPEVNPRVAGSYQVLSRIITCMNIAPMTPQIIARAKEAIKLLETLGTAIQPSLEPVLEKELPDLIQALEGAMSPTEGSPMRTMSRMSSPEIQNPIDIKKAKVEKFQGLVLNLLKEITAVSCTKEWLEAFASAQGKQLSIYNKFPYDKAFLAQCLGFTLSRITTDSFVRDHTVLIFRTMNHSNMIERRGCALAVGECSRHHTSLMLTELENIAKWEHSKKASGGLFGFIKEAYHRGSPDAQAIFLRATIVLSYGYLVNVSPIDFLPQRLDQTVLPFLRQYMVESKNDVVVREAHLESIHMIAQSVLRLTNDYRFDARYEMLSYIKEYVNQEDPEMLSNWIRLFACRATNSLVSLEPPLSDNELRDLATTLSKHVLPICREKSGLKTIDNIDESSTTMESTVAEYRNAIAQMIKKKPIVDTVCTMLKIFINYYGSNADCERIRSIEVTVLILKLYWKYAQDLTVGHASDFPPLSTLLARLTPRIVDSLSCVRHLAIEAVWLSFQLTLLHKGQAVQNGEDIGDGSDSQLFNLNEFKTNFLGFDGKLEAGKGREAITFIAKEIESHLPQSQLQTYISALFKMLNDKQNNVSSAVALLLSIILKDRAKLLHSEAEIIISTIIENLPLIHGITQTYDDLLNALTYFSDEQLNIVVDILLKQPLPYSTEIIDAWKSLSKLSYQFSGSCDQILDSLNCSSTAASTKDSDKPYLSHYEIVDLSGGVIVKLVKPSICSNFAALTQLLNGVESDEALKKRIPKILHTIFHNLSSVIDSQYPSANPMPSSISPSGGTSSTTTAVITGGGDNNSTIKKKKDQFIITPELRRISPSPAALIAECLKILLQRIKAESVIEKMNCERAWTSLIQSDSYITAIGVACRSLCDYYPGYMRSLMLLSLGNVESSCNYLRISSAAILSSLITRCPGENNNGAFDETMLDKVVEELKQFVKDKHLLVRKLAIRGYTAIGTLASSMPNGNIIAQKYAQIAFEAALNGLDDAYDRKDEIAAESICALDSIVIIVEKEFIERFLSNLLLKLRPCFEKENPCLRAVAFSLFGKLGSMIGDSEIFKQNIHENIVSILLHLNDEDDLVKLVCKFCWVMTEHENQNCAGVLSKIAPLFSLDTFSTTISNSLINSKPPHSYSAFLKDIGMILVLSFPDRLNFYALGCSNYFKSQFAQIRSNAALLTGYLLEPLTPALRGTLSKDLVFTSLVQLLRDPSSQVRLSTVKAISCLRSFS